MTKSLENINLRSEEMADILDKNPNWMLRWGNVIFLLILILVIALSYFIKYPDKISSKASVTTVIAPQKEYAQVSAKIAEIFVEDKEIVSKNQPLAILENNANYKDVILLKTFLDSIVFNKLKPSMSLNLLPVLSLGEIQSNYSNFESNYTKYYLFNKISPHSNELLSSKNSIRQLKNQLLNLKIQKDKSATELKFKKSELNRQQVLFDKGIISLSEFDKAQLEYLQYDREFEIFDFNDSKIKVLIEEMQINLSNASNEIFINEISLLNNVNQSISEINKSIKEWEHKYVLKSDIDGTVSFLDFWSIHQTVNEGDLIFTVIPKNNSNFIAKILAPKESSGKIKIGQRVRISLDNYPYSEFGTLIGKVKNIALMPNVAGLYYIEVELPFQLRTSFNKEIDFKQEMSGTSEIITEDLKLIDRIFYQFKDLITK